MPKLAHDYAVQWTDKKRLEVLFAIEDYLCRYGGADAIMQIDRAQVDGLELLAGIADIVQPKYIGED